MKNGEKANEIASLFVIENVSTENELIIREMLQKSAMEMAEWKDEQMKKMLVEFMQYLDKRGFIQDDLCYYTEHQVETFIGLRNRK